MEIIAAPLVTPSTCNHSRNQGDWEVTDKNGRDKKGRKVKVLSYVSSLGSILMKAAAVEFCITLDSGQLHRVSVCVCACALICSEVSGES